jgi:hypothetical protein
MDIDKIKVIINSEMSDNDKQVIILQILAKDKQVIPYIMEMLKFERHQENKLLLETNAELSRALIVLDDKHLKYSKKIVCDPKWVVEQIKEHYIRWKGFIRCTFKIEGLD